MKLYIVRHGETNHNIKGVLQGWSDIELNDNGIKLAKITGQALKDIRFDYCFSSPLKRAYKTAQTILEENINEIPKIIADDRLKEMSFGDWEGLGCTPKRFEIPSKDFNKFYVDIFNFKNADNGESIYDVLKRTKDFYEEIINRDDLKDKIVLITSHGLACRALLNNVYEDKKDFWHGGVPANLAVNIVEIKNQSAKLIGDDLIFYDASMGNNPYKPLK